MTKKQPKKKVKRIVCKVCNDTHYVYSHELKKNVPCLKCPLPCSACKDNKIPYCKETPCSCDCHKSYRMKNVEDKKKDKYVW